LAETGGEQGGSGRVELLDSNSTVELVGSELVQLLSSNLLELELLGFSLIELVGSDVVEVVWWFEFEGRFDPRFEFVDPGSGPEVVSELTSLVLVAVQAETPPEYSNPILSGQPLLPWTWSPSSWIGKPTTAAADGHNSV